MIRKDGEWILLRGMHRRSGCLHARTQRSGSIRTDVIAPRRLNDSRGMWSPFTAKSWASRVALFFGELLPLFFCFCFSIYVDARKSEILNATASPDARPGRARIKGPQWINEQNLNRSGDSRRDFIRSDLRSDLRSDCDLRIARLNHQTGKEAYRLAQCRCRRQHLRLAPIYFFRSFFRGGLVEATHRHLFFSRRCWLLGSQKNRAEGV